MAEDTAIQHQLTGYLIHDWVQIGESAFIATTETASGNTVIHHMDTWLTTSHSLFTVGHVYSMLKETRARISVSNDESMLGLCSNTMTTSDGAFNLDIISLSDVAGGSKSYRISMWANCMTTHIQTEDSSETLLKALLRDLDGRVILMSLSDFNASSVSFIRSSFSVAQPPNLES